LTPIPLPLADNQNNVRYYVTGIFPLSDIWGSIFNDNSNLTFDQSFSQCFGFTVEEALAAFKNINGNEGYSDEEVKSALTTLFNGYQFRGASKTLLNPQYVLHFSQKVRDEMPNITNVRSLFDNMGSLVDENQALSEKLLKFAYAGKDMHNLLSDISHGKPLKAKIRLHSKAMEPYAYLFFSGCLTFTEKDVKLGNDVKLKVPNTAVNWAYAQQYLDLLALHPDRQFIRYPSPENLRMMCRSIIGKNVAEDQNEADLQCRLVACLISLSPLVHCEHSPQTFSKYKGGGDKKRILQSRLSKLLEIVNDLNGVHFFRSKSGHLRMDIAFASEDGLTIIIIELKTLSWSTTQKISRTKNDTFEEYKGNVWKMNEKELMKMNCSYSGSGGKYYTVKELHTSAENQVKKYGDEVLQFPHGRKVYVYAVTQVLNNYVVTGFQKRSSGWQKFTGAHFRSSEPNLKVAKK
jgi:hypothetical protein